MDGWGMARTGSIASVCCSTITESVSVLVSQMKGILPLLFSYYIYKRIKTKVVLASP